MSNFFQVCEDFQQGGSTYRARLWVDNDRKEATLSFSRDGRLFVVSYPVRYGAMWDQSRAKKALRARRNGWGLMSSLARAAAIEQPFDAVTALEEFGLA